MPTTAAGADAEPAAPGAVSAVAVGAVGAASTSAASTSGVGVGVGAVGAVTVRAPNVTVTADGLLEADAHIRVLTPSEIMRTLPSLHNGDTVRPARIHTRIQHTSHYYTKHLQFRTWVY